MEKLSTEKRAAILRCLVEGNSVASTTRITGTAKKPILQLIVDAGEACAEYQDGRMMNLPCKVLQLDEIWSFVGCKEKAREKAKGDHPGDVWTWTALCADTKLIPAWYVGGRDARAAMRFCEDLASRFSGRVQITSDGHHSYQFAVSTAFSEVDFAQLVKIYGQDKDGQEICIGARKMPVCGEPDMDLVSTSYVERANLTIRMQNRRFTRKTNAFSKKLANHEHMLAISFMAYNFCRKHQSLKETPAQAAGIADRRWTFEDIVAITDAHMKRKEDAAFERAFARKDMLTVIPGQQSYRPRKPLTPWYLDKDSGGPSPIPARRKPGILYADDPRAGD